MTHSGGKPHTNVGDKGQRYMMSCFDDEIGRRRVLGWAEEYSVALNSVETLCKRPGWSDPQIKDRELLQSIAAANGYWNLKWVDDRLCAVRRFVYTVGVCVDLDESGYRERFCFETTQGAELFLKDWDGIEPPVVGEDGCTAVK
jgi:hypothetical protein